ncbi:MAG TPA: sigma-70 family RNA polymerase sigma factor [Actinomycetota bacterium]|nr:sigma-70 family RNA polymerase sigma factor [Actinomycetota bacterium]
MPGVSAAQAALSPQRAGGVRPGDTQIVNGLRSGDHGALERLMSEYGRLIASWAGSGDFEPEDVVQEVLLRVWRSRESLSPDTSLPPLLKTITGNAVRNRWRASSRRPSVPAGLDPAAGRAAEDQIGRRTDSIAMAQVMESLAPREREVLELLYLFDLPSSEVARRLDSSLDGVKSLAARARRRLRAELQAADPDSKP